MTDVLMTLLWMSASGSVLGLALLLGRRLFRRLPSTLWYFAWLPVLLRLVLPLPGLLPGLRGAAEAPETAVTQAEDVTARGYRYKDSAGPVSLEEETAQAQTAAAESPAAAQTAAKSPAEDSSGQKAVSGQTRHSVNLRSPRLWLELWIIGAVGFFAWYTAGYLRFRRALRPTLRPADPSSARVYASLAGRHSPRLYRSEHVKTPMLLGLLRPIIVLPRCDFSPVSAGNVLRHELTHYRRGDVYIKWLCVLAASVHWFNPLLPLFRRELDRVCELSCDEQVLSGMEPENRRSYGETLLDLAANRALPAGVVATTFSTEKRALKERLVQIMKFNHKPRAILALTIAALLAVGLLALAAAPARSASPEEQPAPTPSAIVEAEAVQVSDVDSFLDAIGPNTAIVLAPGTYDLSAASNYGQASDSEWYRWEECFDGYELVIEGVENLSISAATDASDVSAAVLAAVPRYADVLAFNNCRGITLTGFTAGHTEAQGVCMGGVVHLTGTQDVSISGCALYGCGVLGVEAENSQNLRVSDTDIYECSNGAVWLTSCRNVYFDSCDFRDCANRYEGNLSPAFQIFKFVSCEGVAITDSHVYGNLAQELMNVSFSQEIYLLGTLFEDNENLSEYDWYSGAVLNVTGNPVVVAGCEFRDDCLIYDETAAITNDGTYTPAVDPDGNALSYDDLAGMTLAHVDFPGFAEFTPAEVERVRGEDGLYTVHVSTVDEFLAAIAPDTTIYLDAGLFDLSKAANYGGFGEQYYYWGVKYDGPELVITGADNLTIVGAGKDETRLEALPRYADVMAFTDCSNVTVMDLTAGHTLGAGSCAGSVLGFYDCDYATVSGCGLFGCGTYGVQAADCRYLDVHDNEIYQCSYGAAHLEHCLYASFDDNDIHDCAYPTFNIYLSANVAIDGEMVEEEPIPAEAIQAFADEPEGTVLYEILRRGECAEFVQLSLPDAGPYKSAQE